MSLYDKITEILKSDVAKDFINEVKNSVLKTAINETKDISKKLIETEIDKQINKFENEATKEILNLIKGQLIDYILKETQKEKGNSEDNKKTETEEPQIIITKKTGDNLSVAKSADTIAKFIKNKKLITPLAAIGAVQDMCNVIVDYYKIREEERTKRTIITAQKEVYISKINSQKEFILKYLDKTFDERKENFDKFFKIVDNALQTNNLDQLTIGVNAITDLAKTSPFKDLSETMKALNDTNTVWEVL